MRDAEVLVLPQRRGHLVVTPHQPGGPRAAGAEPAGRGVEAGVEHLAPLRQVEQPGLADGPALVTVTEVLPGARGHLRHLRLGVAPGFLGRVADQRGDAQPELQRRVRPAERLGERPEPADPLGDAVQRLAPEQLHIGLGSRDLLGRGRRAAEVQARVPAVLRSVRARAQRRPVDGEVPSAERDAFLGPQPPDELHELPGPGVPLGLVALGVAVRREVVLAAHDVDQDPAPAQLVECRGRAGKVSGLPVARPDRDQRLEPGRAGRQRGGHRERVGTAPAGAEQCSGPPVVLGTLRELGGQVQARPLVRLVVAAMASLDSVRDVPEEFSAHGLLPVATGDACSARCGHNQDNR